ncbi:YciI family protein [Kitasatospora purpeofusca]|uniref:YciI family protein n=1 Tax=Kitasatospora purpeofusca TaxID=67352 RepID=UPI00225AC5D3|nr:YciI family protein [Kitasatospora purpeofusca]MCX4758616.1 YciI family protein [Kitasatospora purpeofusca]WSR30945.1 YciI family protein [Kitasatospora purpeofusca]
MMHLLLLEYTRSEADAAPFVAAHVDFLESHHRVGTFLLSGQTVPSDDGGVIVAIGVSRDRAESITREDPLVRAGVARYRVTTVDPGRVHPFLAAAVPVDESRIRPRRGTR